MPKIQSAQSHTAIDPLFHYVLLPILVANFITSIVMAFHAGPRLGLHLWLIVLSFGLLIMAVKVRFYALGVQDRVISLEERLRIAALAPDTNVNALSIKQLVGLRFASDAELPALVVKTLAENLDQKAIKAAIITWRPDNVRI
jgi:hypothetical protein